MKFGENRGFFSTGSYFPELFADFIFVEQFDEFWRNDDGYNDAEIWEPKINARLRIVSTKLLFMKKWF